MLKGVIRRRLVRSLPKVSGRQLIILLAICLAIIALLLQFLPRAARGAISPDIVISQVYGGGGNGGAPFTNDFIELFNRGTTTINITGWAVQYTSSTGVTWQKTGLTGTLAPGQYYLVQEGAGGGVGSPLPAPDAMGGIVMAATAGKVVLTNNDTLVPNGVSCPSGPNVVDIVGYGNAANCFEGAGPTPTISATTAAVRLGSGCMETDNNSSDFVAGPVNPRNTATIVPCGATTNPSGVGAASPNPVAAGNVVLLTVTVTPGANPTSTDLVVTGNLASIGGTDAQSFFDDGTNGDDDAGDNVFSFQIQVASSGAPGPKILPISIRDAQSRSGSLNINLTVQPAPPPGNVVISQIYGGGGNSGASFTNDFIELFNRSQSPVNLSGWSAQSAPSTSASWQKVDLNGTLAPGQYYLIRLASGGANGEPLPAADAVGTINMAATTGKVALVNNGVLLNTSCPIGPNVVDFVGYGNSANCFEGSDSTPAPAADKAAVRIGQGCADTNNNATNFLALAPAPRNTSSPFNVCGRGARFEDLSVKITDNAACAASGNIVAIEVKFTNRGIGIQGDNAGPELIAQLPAELIALNNSCAATSGACVITNASRFEWNGQVKIAETITITLQAQVKDGVATGAMLCVAANLNYDSDGDSINDTITSNNGCLTVNCAPAGPGAVFPASSEASDQKPGSILIYPLYGSTPANLQGQDTRINITNTDPTRRVVVHLFFQDDDSASVADAFLCLTPNQTASFLASDMDPGANGYLIVIAVDERTGCPINFNHLIGDEYVKLSSGHAANLAAEAFAALTGAPPICADNATTVEINLDGISYNAAPRILAVDNIPSPVDGNSTLLVIDRIGGSLATGLSTIGDIFGVAYDDLEQPASFAFSTTRRQFRQTISASFPRTSPRIPALIPSGRSGWMKFSRQTDGAIIGCVINFNPNASSDSSAFNQGRNLSKLSLTTAASFTLPIIRPNC
ncbi:MAG TPA: lamin tail domain-containing protein [Blastocatellia bacterium]|nr:lamin tail domain-containing protein [Blastocatellia bacterium]